MKTLVTQFCILSSAGILKSLAILHHSGSLHINTEIQMKILYFSVMVELKPGRIRKRAIKYKPV